MTLLDRFTHRQPFIVCCAVSMHLTWGILALISPESSKATTTSAFGWHPYLTGVSMLLVAVSALIGLLVDYRLWVVALTLPQQLVLAFSADAALTAMAQGHYADGTVRPWDFIMSDQCLPVYLCLWHAIAVGVVAFRGET
jgi:hypothetical protein